MSKQHSTGVMESGTAPGLGHSRRTISHAPHPRREQLLAQYRAVRQASEALCETLEPEDCVLQTMPEMSPTKWHLAHTSWFFETFVARPHLAGYRPLNEQYAFLFNSYYHAAGRMHARPQRGLISRPTLKETFAYRKHVDAAIGELLQAATEEQFQSLAPLIILGLNHEQQHQELILTDIKHAFWMNPLRPVFRPIQAPEPGAWAELEWRNYPEGVYEIGYQGGGFHFDNEGPRHRALLPAFALGSRLVTNREYLGFIEEEGYQRPEFWLSLGWNSVCERGWRAPLYWEERSGDWWHFTLAGMRGLELEEPVCHLSYFEADAYARWAGARLPSEAEWEAAARELPVEGSFVEAGHFHPAPLGSSGAGPNGSRTLLSAATPGGRQGPGAQAEPAADRNVRAPEQVRAGAARELGQLYGEVWQWTRSSYAPYPGYRPAPGALGEYNGKFMCNQYVLRGASCATPRSHARATYRNFFPPEARWQFAGLRLARDR